MAGLINTNIFKLVHFSDISESMRIFNFRFINEMKNAETDKAFKKSKLVIQTYNDLEKSIVLMQSPTI